jgi:hypothetical protein
MMRIAGAGHSNEVVPTDAFSLQSDKLEKIVQNFSIDMCRANNDNQDYSVQKENVDSDTRKFVVEYKSQNEISAIKSRALGAIDNSVLNWLSNKNHRFSNLYDIVR